MRSIDINCDLGESFGNWKLGRDEEVIPQITTANIACGFHGGDPLTMLRTVAQAKEYDVVVGAHPGLPDLLGFGRRVMGITPEDAYAYVVYQMGALAGALLANNMELHHVKPHGALYVMLRDDAELAAAVVEAICDTMEHPLLYWPAPLEVSALARVARATGVKVVGEMCPDLEYTANGSLMLQREKRLTEPAKVAKQLRRFLEDGCVEASDGSLVALEADSISVHGDAPNVVDVVQTVRKTLEECGCSVQPIENERRVAL